MSVVWQISPSVHSVVLIAAIKAAVIFSGWLALQGYGAAICQMKTRRVGSRIDLQTQPALIWGQCGAEQCSARRDVCKKFEARSIQSQPVVSVNLQMDWAHGLRVPTIWLDLQGGRVFVIHILTPMIIHPFSCVQFLSQQYRSKKKTCTHLICYLSNVQLLFVGISLENVKMDTSVKRSVIPRRVRGFAAWYNNRVDI